MAGAYLVQVDPECGQTLVAGADAMVVYANDTTDAKAICAGRFAGSPPQMWENATVTAIAAGADLEGWRLHIEVLGVGEGETLEVTVTGAAAATVDTIGALAVIALNATSQIAGAAYNSGTNVLTVAETTDGLGDATLVAEMLPPAATFLGPDTPIVSFISTVVHEGASGDALKCTLVASTIPKVWAAVSVR